MVNWLARRGVASDVVLFDGDVARGLLHLANAHSADLIVAGAYGHSRMEELMFGGVTRSLLRAETMPALALAH